MTTNRVLIDTNVLVYMASSDSPLHIAAFERVYALEQSGCELHVCPQVLREFYGVSTRAAPHGYAVDRSQALAHMKFFASRFSLLIEDVKCWNKLTGLLHNHSLPGKVVYDASLVALMLRYGLNKILTEDLDDFAFFKDRIQAIRVRG